LQLALAVAGCGRIGFQASTADASSDAGDVTAGLVGWWKLDDGQSTTALDSSPQNNAGTLSAGITWVTGKIGGAIRMDATDDEDVDLGDPPVLHMTGSMSLAAWVNPAGFKLGSAFDEVIISRDDLSHLDYGWSLKSTEDCGPERFAIQIPISAVGVAERCSGTAPTIGSWYHVAGVYDAAAQTLDIYIDGSNDNATLTAPVPTALHVATTPVHTQIGNANPTTNSFTGGQNAYSGVLDDVRIYNRALSAAEVAVLAR
jgi:hypothetical protein